MADLASIRGSVLFMGVEEAINLHSRIREQRYVSKRKIKVAKKEKKAKVVGVEKTISTLSDAELDMMIAALEKKGGKA